MGQQGLLLGGFEQNSTLFSQKTHNFLRFQGCEVVEEDGFHAALKDVVQHMPPTFKQRLEIIPNGRVDQQEQMLDDGFVDLSQGQELAPDEVQDYAVFFGLDAEEHHLDYSLTDVQTIEGLQLPSKCLVLNLCPSFLLLLHPIKPTSYTLQQLLQESATQLQSFLSHELDNLLGMDQSIYNSPTSEISNPHFLHSFFQSYQHLLWPLIVFSANQNIFRYICRERRVEKVHLYEIVLLQGLYESLMKFLRVVRHLNIRNKDAKFLINPRDDILPLFRPLLYCLQQLLISQHTLRHGQVEIIPASYPRVKSLQTLATVLDPPSQVANLQPRHGFSVVGTITIDGGHHILDGCNVDVWSLAEEQALKRVL